MRDVFISSQSIVMIAKQSSVYRFKRFTSKKSLCVSVSPRPDESVRTGVVQN